jgi:hypothetical protein
MKVLFNFLKSKKKHISLRINILEKQIKLFEKQNLHKHLIRNQIAYHSI